VSIVNLGVDNQAIDAIRQSSWYGQRLPVYIHDGFDLNRFQPYINNRRDFVVQDHHSYFVFTDNDSKKPSIQHTKDIKGGIADAFSSAANGERRNLVIGEWSCALSEESLKDQKDKLQARKEFCTAQMQVYTNVTAGWMFWCLSASLFLGSITYVIIALKNEQCEFDPGWCFQHAVGTVLPTSFYSYGDIASSAQGQDLSAKARRMDYPNDAEVVSVLSQASGNGRHSQDAVDVSPGNSQHRFEAIYQRQSSGTSQPLAWNTTDPAVENWNSGKRDGISSPNYDPARRKGFDDGFQTAKVFAIYGASKLGFTEQYISEAIEMAQIRGTLSGESEKEYRSGFWLGLRHGESKVIETIKST